MFDIFGRYSAGRGRHFTDNHYEMFDCNSLRSIGMAAVQDIEINKNDIKLLEFKRSSV